MSSAIAQPESGFGVQLLIRRHAHGSALTPTGKRFMEQARVVLAEADRLGQLAMVFNGVVRGPLRVGCMRRFVQTIIPQVRRGFGDKHENVDFSQLELDQAQIFDGLRQARIDVAITYDLAVPSDITFRPLHALPPYVLLSPDHPLATCPTLHPEELLDHPMVQLDLPYSAEYFMSHFRSTGRRPRISERR